VTIGDRVKQVIPLQSEKDKPCKRTLRMFPRVGAVNTAQIRPEKQSFSRGHLPDKIPRDSSLEVRYRQDTLRAVICICFDEALAIASHRQQSIYLHAQDVTLRTLQARDRQHRP